MDEYRCTECGKLHNDGEDCPEVVANLAAAEQRGYERGEEHGYACGWKQAMVAVESNGCSKLGMITIPISLLRLLSDKYLKEGGKNGTN